MTVDRWFQAAEIRPADKGFEIVLDGKPIRAKSGRLSVAPTRELAAAIAEEWNAVGEKVDFQDLPLILMKIYPRSLIMYILIG